MKIWRELPEGGTDFLDGGHGTGSFTASPRCVGKCGLSVVRQARGCAETRANVDQQLDVIWRMMGTTPAISPLPLEPVCAGSNERFNIVKK